VLLAPEVLETHPYLNREAENQPYLEWLRRYDNCSWENGDNFHDEADSGDETSEEDEESMWSIGSEVSSDGEDHTTEVASQDLENSNGVESNVLKSNIRRFMEGLNGSEEILPYRDQVDAVAGFCEMDGANEGILHKTAQVETIWQYLARVVGMKRVPRSKDSLCYIGDH